LATSQAFSISFAKLLVVIGEPRSLTNRNGYRPSAYFKRTSALRLEPAARPGSGIANDCRLVVADAEAEAAVNDP
jgi:hypothetical protein